MGIRFLCPHCDERLNVKAAQAGLMGECPHCHDELTVPFESTIVTSASSKKIKYTSTVTLPLADDQVTEATPEYGENLESDEFLDAFRHVIDRHVEQSPGEPDTASGESFLLDKPQPFLNRGDVDPIEQAPDKVWYFRCRRLGEKGPFKGRQMQEQIDRGNVLGDCIVWREDWEDWQLAEKVFPGVAQSGAKAKQNPLLPIPIRNQRKTNSIRTRFTPIILAAVAAGLLLISGLVYLWIQLSGK